MTRDMEVLDDLILALDLNVSTLESSSLRIGQIYIDMYTGEERTYTQADHDALVEERRPVILRSLIQIHRLMERADRILRYHVQPRPTKDYQMDPDANLAEQMRLRKQLRNGTADADDIARLNELRDALSDWISAGGFPPKAWLNLVN